MAQVFLTAPRVFLDCAGDLLKDSVLIQLPKVKPDGKGWAPLGKIEFNAPSVEIPVGYLPHLWPATYFVAGAIALAIAMLLKS